MEELIKIRDDIEGMTKNNQIEILNLLKNNNVIINENMNGTHINLSEVKPEIIQSIKLHIILILKQDKDNEIHNIYR